MSATMSTWACAPCVAAWGRVVAQEACPPHTESQVRLARKISAIFQGDETDEHTGWFLDDAEAVDEAEGDGWIVEKREDWRNNPVLRIQGVDYALDINAEGHVAIEPFSELRARLDEDWDDPA